MRNICLLLTVFLVSCLSTGKHVAAPVEDINRAPPKLTGMHQVKPGESLYTIAWRYNRDFNELAQINGISKPYTVHAGQNISLEKRKAAPKPVRTVKKPTPASKPIQKAKAATQTTVAANTGPIQWHWPSTGKIIQNFSSQKGQKGIDISGKSGQPIFAAAPGVVVYSGSGLRGYGQLIILKHNEEYLSAYAHNRQLLVKEGDSVKAMQKIAEMGQTDTDSVRLHFEIRQKGQPINPLQVLPKR